MQSDWQADENANHEVSLKFGAGDVALGFGHSVRARKLSLLDQPLRIGQSIPYSNGTLTRVQGLEGRQYVKICLEDEGCGECSCDEVYKMQLQEATGAAGMRWKRLKIECYSECQCDGSDIEECDKFTFYAHPLS